MDIYLWSCCSDSRQLLENKRGLFSIKTRWVEHSLEWEKKLFFFFLQERESYPVTSYLDLDVLFGWTTHKPKHQHSFTKRQEKEKSRSESLLFLAFVLYFCAVSSRGFHAVRIPNEALTSAVRLEALSPFLSVHPPPLPSLSSFSLCLCSGCCAKARHS